MSQSQMMINRLKQKPNQGQGDSWRSGETAQRALAIEMNMAVTRKRLDQKLVNGQIMEHFVFCSLTKLPLLYTYLEPNYLHS